MKKKKCETTGKEIVTICCSCKKARLEDNSWAARGTEYDLTSLGFDVSHGICDDCGKRLYPGIFQKVMKKLETNLVLTSLKALYN